MARDTQVNLEVYTRIRQDPELRARIGDEVSQSILFVRSHQNELDDCIAFLSIFEQPMELFQVKP